MEEAKAETSKRRRSQYRGEEEDKSKPLADLGAALVQDARRAAGLAVGELSALAGGAESAAKAFTNVAFFSPSRASVASPAPTILSLAPVSPKPAEVDEYLDDFAAEEKLSARRTARSLNNEDVAEIPSIASPGSSIPDSSIPDIDHKSRSQAAKSAKANPPPSSDESDEDGLAGLLELANKTKHPRPDTDSDDGDGDGVPLVRPGNTATRPGATKATQQQQQQQMKQRAKQQQQQTTTTTTTTTKPPQLAAAPRKTLGDSPARKYDADFEDVDEIAM
jgi:hypothetical protein